MSYIPGPSVFSGTNEASENKIFDSPKNNCRLGSSSVIKFHNSPIRSMTEVNPNEVIMNQVNNEQNNCEQQLSNFEENKLVI